VPTGSVRICRLGSAVPGYPARKLRRDVWLTGALLTTILPACALVDAARGGGASPDAGPPPLFTQRIDYDTPGIRAVAIADAAGNDRPDVVFADGTPALVAISRGQQLRVRDLPYGFEHLVAADLDGDGKLDLVGSNGRRLLIVLGLFSRLPVAFEHEVTLSSSFSRIDDLAVGDLDQDGHADIAAATDGVPFVLLQTARGEGDFSRPPVELGIGPSSSAHVTRVAIGDRNGDGHNDLFVLQPHRSPGRVSVLPQGTPGAFGLLETFTGDAQLDAYIDLLLTDMDGNGRADVLILQKNYGELTAFVPGTGTLDSHRFGPFERVFADRMVVGDIILDDGLRRELVVGAALSSEIYVFDQSSPLELGTPQVVPSAQTPTALAIGDVDGDGRADVAAQGTDKLSLFLTGPPPP